MNSTARVELSSNGVEFWRCVAFDAVKFVPVVHDMAVTDVFIMPPTTSVGQSTAICVRVTNEGSQQEGNVSVKAFVDGAQVGSTKYVSLDPGSSDTMTFLWIPRAAKNYSVAGEVGVVSGETDTGDNRKAIEVLVPVIPTPAPIFDEIRDTTEEKSTQLTASETYTFITKWGNAGSGDGAFKYARSIAVDSSGNVYVADSANYRIQKFDSVGTFITKWGTSGSGDGEFDYPEGIAADSSGNVFVADEYNHRIQKFDSVGTFITKWGSAGTGDGEFFRPWGIAVDSSGNVYVADAHSRIQKFDSDGNFITKWGSYGTGDGEFSYPHDIAVDSSGNVYVADRHNDRIQKFDSDGNFITKWGSWGTGDGEFNRLVAILNPMKCCLLRRPLLRAYCSFLWVSILRAFPNYSATSLMSLLA